MCFHNRYQNSKIKLLGEETRVKFLARNGDRKRMIKNYFAKELLLQIFTALSCALNFSALVLKMEDQMRGCR